jgi:hypothetical protein
MFTGPPPTAFVLLLGADRADPMPGKNERQGRSANIFFFHEGSLQGHEKTAPMAGLRETSKIANCNILS